MLFRQTVRFAHAHSRLCFSVFLCFPATNLQFIPSHEFTTVPSHVAMISGGTHNIYSGLSCFNVKHTCLVCLMHRLKPYLNKYRLVLGGGNKGCGVAEEVGVVELHAESHVVHRVLSGANPRKWPWGGLVLSVRAVKLWRESEQLSEEQGSTWPKVKHPTPPPPQ